VANTAAQQKWAGGRANTTLEIMRHSADSHFLVFSFRVGAASWEKALGAVAAVSQRAAATALFYVSLRGNRNAIVAD